jgi:hypothetical protein
MSQDSYRKISRSGWAGAQARYGTACGGWDWREPRSWTRKQIVLPLILRVQGLSHLGTGLTIDDSSVHRRSLEPGQLLCC